ncbi:MAG: hypothetical protein ABSC93_20760 [Bryobacteraceae bacterium]|jgi:sugar lactone lactonase YvrE
MKLTQFAYRLVPGAATAILCLGIAITAITASAAKNPLNEPNGLAVDSKGNLYVANSGGNNILMFNSKYQYMPAKTLVQGVSHPTGVAVDPMGNLWVANYIQGGGSITEYSNGQQVSSGTITEGVDSPLAIAADGSGNIWVQNANTYVDAYRQPVLGIGAPTLAQTFNVTAPLYGISVWENTLALGAPSAFEVGFANALVTLERGSFAGAYSSTGSDNGLSIAADHQGGFYISNLDGSVNHDLNGVEAPFLQLSYGPAGTAVDPVNQRVYFSCLSCNYIQAYSTTTGQLLETIQ